MKGAVEEALDRAAQLLAGARYLVALVGAGLSAESGIPTFRGPGGLYQTQGSPDTRSYRRFLQDPASWWRQYLDQAADPARAALRRAIERARPNPGHYALAELERLGLLRYTISQNVDGLHYKAGSRRVGEIHGSRMKVRCVACLHRQPRDTVDPSRLPPLCPRCGSPMKSDTVMFGEPIPADVLEECRRHAALSDCMLVAGTSATVYPAAGFPRAVKERGGALIEVNPNPTPLSSMADVVLRGPTGQLLPALVRRVQAYAPGPED